jgi:hypothetical protein
LAFPTVAGRSNGAVDDATTLTVTFDTSPSAGDGLLVVITTDDAPVVDDDGSWAELFAVANGTAVKVTAFYKQASGSEGASDDFSISVANDAAYRFWRFTGHNDFSSGADSIDFATATASSTNWNPPSLDPANWTTEETYWIAGYGGTADATATAYPTELTVNNVTQSSPSSGQVSDAVAEYDTAGGALGSIDPSSATKSAASTHVVWTIGVRPTTGGGGGDPEARLVGGKLLGGGLLVGGVLIN